MPVRQSTGARAPLPAFGVQARSAMQTAASQPISFQSVIGAVSSQTDIPAISSQLVIGAVVHQTDVSAVSSQSHLNLIQSDFSAVPSRPETTAGPSQAVMDFQLR
jgi:hypothetical protein